MHLGISPTSFIFQFARRYLRETGWHSDGQYKGSETGQRPNPSSIINQRPLMVNDHLAIRPGSCSSRGSGWGSSSGSISRGKRNRRRAEAAAAANKGSSNRGNMGSSSNSSSRGSGIHCRSSWNRSFFPKRPAAVYWPFSRFLANPSCKYYQSQSGFLCERLRDNPTIAEPRMSGFRPNVGLPTECRVSVWLSGFRPTPLTSSIQIFIKYQIRLAHNKSFKTKEVNSIIRSY